MLSEKSPAGHPRDDVIPPVVPPLPRERHLGRNLPPATALDWLREGWSDFRTHPTPSILYGLAIYIVSMVVVWLLFYLELDYFIFPALAGFVVIGPLVASGLYEKSRRLEAGEPVSFASMIFVRPRAGRSALFMGVMLLGLFLLWQRAAVIVYSLFFGVVAFPGIDEIAPMLFLTSTGWALLIVGGAVGALFAAFGFAISVFAAPMLLEEKTDALSAFALSIAMVWNNLPVMIAWGAIVLALFIFSVLTALIGLIVVFPVLGHATWRAYKALKPTEEQRTYHVVGPRPDAG
ncbi:DUF2189 domain-containing protein [Pikeienuella sp. HZG-20]|uniref:DUF2189 domain-containing protein n=1 Tax=Paludibacillus litoralis TaxID=3133267 RepID=UPI0030EF9929